VLSKIVSLFVAHLSVFILIWMERLGRKWFPPKKQMAGSLVLDSLPKDQRMQAKIFNPPSTP
jgi:hypothetical protein